MSKLKSVFVCKECGADSPKWIGRCPLCGSWNSYVEQKVDKKIIGGSDNIVGGRVNAISINDIVSEGIERISSSNGELDRVLGGGIVPGSLVLIGGEPGIGKSTLTLQMALCIEKKVLYVSGEESAQQIKLRGDRIKSINGNNCYVLSDTCIDRLIDQIESIAPEIVIIDSIQTMETERVDSVAGSISQIRECTALLMKIAKSRGLPIIVIGHINKDGQLAGPKVLEHMVDVVLQFEGDRDHQYRILRSIKNRYGSTNEIGIFEMLGDGLREVSNASELLLSEYSQCLSGVSIAASMEGLRPLLVEVQALTSTAAYGTPQRSATGYDGRRLNMLLAVLEKRAGFKLATKDVFINIAGGLRVIDPAIDLAVAASVLSSNADLPIRNSICLTGEIGLSGEIRPVNRIDQRIMEADKLGFKEIIIPRYPRYSDFGKVNITIKQVSRMDEVIKLLFS